MVKVEIELSKKLHKHFTRYAIPEEECLQGIINSWYNEKKVVA